MTKRAYKWSWVACAACFWTLLFIQGTVRSAGLFYVSVVEQWDLNREQASWPFNLRAALEGVGEFLTGFSQQKNVVCKGSIFAAFLFSTGFALSSLTKNIYALVFLIGAVGGLCSGYIVAACFICICHSFNRYRNIAMGLAVSGSAMGAIVLPYLFGFLIQTFTMSHVFLLVSAATLQMMVTVMLCRLATLKIKEQRFFEKQNGEAENVQQSAVEMEVTEGNNVQTDFTIQINNLPSAKDKITFQKRKTFCMIKLKNGLKRKLAILKHPFLFMYVFSFSVLIFCIQFWMLIIVDVGKDKGFDPTTAAGLISSTSIASLLGRFSFGWTIDFGCIKAKTGLIVLFCFMAISAFSMPHTLNIYVVFALSALFGFPAGAIDSTRASIAAVYFGMKGMPFAIGMSGVVATVPSLFRPWIIDNVKVDDPMSPCVPVPDEFIYLEEIMEWLKNKKHKNRYFRDKEGSYNNTFYLIGSLSCLAAVLWLMEPFAMKLHSRNKNEGNNEYNDI